MKLEKQVTSIKLAQELKKAGMPQDSYAYWYLDTIGKDGILVTRNTHGNPNRYYAAYTIAELESFLPCEIIAYDPPKGYKSIELLDYRTYRLELRKDYVQVNAYRWQIAYLNRVTRCALDKTNDYDASIFWGDDNTNLVDLYGLMLLWLRKWLGNHGYIKL